MCNKCDHENHHSHVLPSQDAISDSHPGCGEACGSGCNHRDSHDHACGEGCEHASREPDSLESALRRYDDPHPASLAEGARNQWELYLREVRETSSTYRQTINDAEEALANIARQRQSLGAAPSTDAQRTVMRAYEYASMHWLHGVCMTYFDTIEAVGEAQSQIELVGEDARPGTPQRLDRLGRRLERILSEAEVARDSVDKKYKAEEEALKAACPQYEELAPKFVTVSGPAF